MEDLEIEQRLNDIMDVVKEYRDIVGACIDHVNELDSIVIDGLINPVTREMEAMDLKQRKDAFLAEAGDKLSKFDRKLSAIEGKPVSLNDIAFDEYSNLQMPEGVEKPSITEFVDKEVEMVSEQINNILGALQEAETTEEVEQIAEEAKEVIENAAEEKKEEVKEEEGEKKEEAPAVEGEVVIEKKEEEEEPKKKSDEDIIKENLKKAMAIYG